jgi:hypothetical protein
MALGGDDYFSGYEITTFDPGWTVTIVVIVLCSLMNLSLPLLLRIGKYWEDRRTISSNTASAGDHSPAGFLLNVDFNANLNRSNSNRDLYGNLNRSNSDLYANLNRSTSDLSISPKKGRRFGLPNPSYAASASVVSESHSTTGRSVVSFSDISQIAWNVLDVKVKKGKHQRYHHHQTEKWAQTVDEESRNKPLGYPDGRLIEFDDTSVCPSVMSKLDQDAVSVHDAVDAQEGSPSQNITIENASGWQRLVEIAEWEFEMKRMGSLAVPYTIQGITEGVFQMINVSVIGNFIGVREANAYVVVTILLEFTATLTYGFGEGKVTFDINININIRAFVHRFSFSAVSSHVCSRPSS